MNKKSLLVEQKVRTEVNRSFQGLFENSCTGKRKYFRSEVELKDDLFSPLEFSPMCGESTFCCLTNSP